MSRSIHIGPFGPGGPFIGRSFNGGPNWDFGITRVIIMFLFLLLIGAIAYFVIRHFDRAQMHHHANFFPTGAASTDNAAAEVLKMRFAKGEIDEDEFTRRMNLLKEHQSIS